MDNSNLHHSYIDRMAPNQRFDMHPLSSSAPRDFDMAPHSHHFSKVHSSGMDSSQVFKERRSPYQGLMSSSYASSSLPSHGSAFQRDYRTNPLNNFNEQYSQLQQARMMQQMKTQNDALQRQHQTFAMRQMLNPPLMSRQASAINLHQSHISTQTTSSVQCSPTLNQPSTSMPQQQPQQQPHQQQIPGQQSSQQYASSSHRPDQLNLQNDQQQLLRALQQDLKAHLAQQNANRNDGNPFKEETQSRRDQDGQSPVHQAMSYKSDQMSSSSATSTPTKLLKSPQTKRPTTATVTFSGWLYKQGSDGLRVWRKRWFVLVEYCLFYYKGPEEDKLLGSILLPSYSLSECLPHEKAYRRFSFKLEHKNMRTYYLASENGDYMHKWMRVIRAATLMQNSNEIQTRQMIAEATPISTAYTTATDEQERWIHNQKYTKPSSSNNPFIAAVADDPHERQPLYANAPPKPRRTHNDVEYSTFATEMLFPFRRSDYNTDTVPSSEDSQPETVTPTNAPPPHRMFSEYEEIYNAQADRIKNMSLYGTNTSHRSNAKSFALNDYGGEQKIDATLYQQPKPMPPRPRSADFLEYESKKQMRKMAQMGGGDMNDPFSSQRLPSRPKSSLDINSSVDNYYYSEASYAAKMRQSAQYLQSRNAMRPQSALRDEFNRNTLRYENERKRLTSEFQSYTASAAAAAAAVNKLTAINTNSLPSNFQRTDEWKYSPMKRKGMYSTAERSTTSRDGKFATGETASSPSTPERQFAAEHHPSAFGVSATLPKANSSKSHAVNRDDQNEKSFWNPDISTGALLSKTHEELILLLIQLRRQNDAKERAIKRGSGEIEAIQERLNTTNSATATRLDMMSRVEILREQIHKLEKKYEKNKPLVNLVDNMVKLGALYRTGSLQWSSNTMASMCDLNRLHANQRNQERKLIADDRNEWNKYNSRQMELHHKVQQLYELDEQLQEESDNLHLLQRDKEDIEGALAELNRKFATDHVRPESYVSTKELQHSLEAELSKIHHQLAVNAQKLEQTVSGNSRLERELLVLRQKLQATRGAGKSSKGLYHASSTNDCTTDAFDSELRKVQSLAGDMQRQQQELSLAVNQLTMNTNPFVEPVRPTVAAPQRSIPNTLPSYLTKRLHSSWTETDLDSNPLASDHMMDAVMPGDLSDTSQTSSYQSQTTIEAMHTLNTPDYIYGNDLFPYSDKQEIKTVRIVKRESERRNRDKDKPGGPLIGSNVFDHIAELQGSDELNDYLSSSYKNDPRLGNYSEDDTLLSDDELGLSPTPNAVTAPKLPFKSNRRVETALKNISIDRNAATGNSNSDYFHSSAARQIHSELAVMGANNGSGQSMSKQQLTDMANQYKRNVPRKKKRHNTAPNTVHNETFNDYLASQNASKQNNYRARDDLDMEVALRTNMPNIAGGAPDIVRSALGQSNDYYHWPR